MKVNTQNKYLLLSNKLLVSRQTKLFNIYILTENDNQINILPVCVCVCVCLYNFLLLNKNLFEIDCSWFWKIKPVK